MPFSNPTGIANDGTYIYIANNDNSGQILKLNTSSTVIATYPSLPGIAGIVHLNGNLYACDQASYTISQINTTTGAQSLFAGISATQGTPPVDGPLGVATFNNPIAITTDGTDVYVIDDTLIRMVNVASSPAGYVTTLVPTGTFTEPTGISYYSGNLYVAEQGVSSYTGIATVSIANPATITNIVALSGNRVYDLSVINANSIYYSGAGSDLVNYYNGSSSTIIAGSLNSAGYVNDAIGTNARFHGTTYLTILGSNLYVSDQLNNVVRSINLSGSYPVTTFYGSNPPVNPCIPAGQLIRTLKGDVPVETVKSGDYIMTPDGRSVVVKVYKSTLLANRHDAPYLIPANTFRPGYPKKDIQLSPNHKIQTGPDLWLSAEKASKMYPAIKQLLSTSFVRYFHFETPDFLTDDLVVEGSVVESYGPKYCEKYLKGKQPYAWSEKYKAEIRMVPGHWRM